MVERRRALLARSAAAVLWVVLIAQGFVPASAPGAPAQATDPAAAPAAAPAQLAGVPVEGEEGEQDQIRERQERLLRRLAYPGTTIPAAWRSRAAEHISRNVRDGLDFGSDVDRTRLSGGTGAGSDAAITVPTASWKAVGPAPIDNNAASGGYKYGLVTGRMNAIAVDPTDTRIVYAGAAAGGLWKTTTCCSSSTVWTPLWDDKNFVTQAVGAIKIHPGNPRIVYVGTGDPAGDQHGEGIMRTLDGGATWTQLGANVFTPFGALSPTAPDQNITSIEIVRANGTTRLKDTIIVGARHGLFMSYDAGASWVKVPVHGRAGQSQYVSSILLDGTTMYVAVGLPTSWQFGDIGGGNGVYKAPVPTSGNPSFTLMATGWPAGTGSGFANSVGRIRLAGSRGNGTNTLTIYAQVGDYVSNGALGTWVTRNGGANWTRLNGSSQTSFKDCNGAILGDDDWEEHQDWYDLAFAVSPANDRVLYIGRVDLYKATVDAGYSQFATLGNLTTVYNDPAWAGGCPATYGKVHPDNHAFAWVGTAGTKFLLGNDGGLYYNDNAGAAANWTPLYRGINTIQFYAGQLGANFASASQWAMGGSQDNGNESWDSSNADMKWQARGNGGDGFFVAFDPLGGTKTAGVWHTEYTYGKVYCSTAGAGGTYDYCMGPWYDNQSPPRRVDRADWSTPYVLDQVHCRNTSCRNLALGTYRVFASGTGGSSRTAWTAVSGDLTKGSTGYTSRNVIIDLRIAPSDPKTVVVGTDDGTVAWSPDVFTCSGTVNTSTFSCAPNATATWTKLMSGTGSILPNRAIEGVAMDPTNARVIYAAVGGFSVNTPGTPGHVFRASCASSCQLPGNWTWQNKTANLPDVPASSIIANPNNAKQVFVGTHFGFYYTNDITASSVVWKRFQTGLPNTVIKYLTVDRAKSTLGAFTYGRGLYVVRLPGPGGFNACQAYEPNASAASATAIAARETQTHYFCAGNDKDWLKFTAIAGHDYTVGTGKLATGVDTVMELYAADGVTRLKVHDDRSGTDKSSVITHRATANGTLYVKLWNKSNAGHETYRYDVALTHTVPCTAYETNGSPATATPITDGATQTHVFCAAGDQDWLKFTASAGRDYTISTSRLAPGVDTVMDLYAANGTTLLKSHDDRSGTDKSSVITHRVTANGAFYVKLRNKSDLGNAAYTYDVRLSSVATPTLNRCTSDEPNGDPTSAKAYTALGSVKQYGLCEKQDQDWILFDAAPYGAEYRIDALNVGANLDIGIACWWLNPSSGQYEYFHFVDAAGKGGSESAACFGAPSNTAPFRIYVQFYDASGDSEPLNATSLYDARIVQTKAGSPPARLPGERRAAPATGTGGEGGAPPRW